MTVDAASLGCCCQAQVPLTCTDIWSCSTVQKFKLIYNVGITYRRQGTSAAGLQTLYEHIITLSGSHTYRKGSIAPIPSSLPNVYPHLGPSDWTFYSRARWRQFFTSVNCNPCGSTYLYQESLTNASGSSGPSPPSGWADFFGYCAQCAGCNGVQPKYIAFPVGGPGSYTRNQTVWNQNGVPSTNTFSGGCFCKMEVLPPDGCITPQWFPDCNWFFNRLYTTAGSTIVADPLPPPNCVDIDPPNRCGYNLCDPPGTSSDYSASGCTDLFGDTHVCQTGAGFVCACDGVETNGCLPTIDSYDKFGSFSIQIV